MNSISMRAVSKQFASKPILKDIHLTCHSKDIVGISGINGSGKTTLMKLLCGLVSPDTGTIHINALEAVTERRQTMHHLGVLLDGSRNLYWKLSAWENFIYLAGLKGIFGEPVAKRGQDLLTRLNLWEARHKRVESFSLGMKQKLSIACAFSHNPSIFILDEPTTGLDKEAEHILAGMVREQATLGKIILITSHDTHFLDAVCTRKHTLESGTIL